jgi:hypothetical protein
VTVKHSHLSSADVAAGQQGHLSLALQRLAVPYPLAQTLLAHAAGDLRVAARMLSAVRLQTDAREALIRLHGVVLDAGIRQSIRDILARWAMEGTAR